MQEAQKRGTDKHSLCGDPLFACVEKGDYQVRKHSSALRIGFCNFDMRHFGVQVLALREKALQPVLPKLSFNWKEGEELPIHSWRGLSLKNVTSEGERSAAGLDAVRDVWIKEIGTNKDGFRKNDVIVRFHGKTVYTWHDIFSQLDRCISGETITANVIREQKVQELKFLF